MPLVVRLEGTNVELGKKILAESGLKIVPADDLADAAAKITAAVKRLREPLLACSIPACTPACTCDAPYVAIPALHCTVPLMQCSKTL